MIDLEHHRGTLVDVRPNEPIRPLERIGMEPLVVRSLFGRMPAQQRPVQTRKRAVVQTAANVIGALGGIGGTVAARLKNIDLSAHRPGTVLRGVFGKHPDGGPKPVAPRKFGADLDLAVLDVFLAQGVDSGRHDGVDNCSEGSVGGGGTSGLVGISERAIGEGIGGTIQDVGDLVRGEGGLDVELLVLDKEVVGIIGRHLEFAVAKATKLDLAVPDRVVEGGAGKSLVHDHAELGLVEERHGGVAKVAEGGGT